MGSSPICCWLIRVLTTLESACTVKASACTVTVVACEPTDKATSTRNVAEMLTVTPVRVAVSKPLAVTFMLY